MDYCTFTTGGRYTLGLGDQGIDLDVWPEDADGNVVIQSWPPTTDGSVEWLMLNLEPDSYISAGGGVGYGGQRDLSVSGPCTRNCFAFLTDSSRRWVDYPRVGMMEWG